MSPEQMRKEIETADVVWLAGGVTPVQYRYFQKYGLVPVLRQHKGVIIGMSAGSINIAQTAICVHDKIEIYQALGLVDISVKPHFNINGALDKLLKISQEYPIYGICDDSVIICNKDKRTYIGDIYLINKGVVTKIS